MANANTMTAIAPIATSILTIVAEVRNAAATSVTRIKANPAKTAVKNKTAN